ncbi:UPF0178 protein [Hypericibacter terrae]|jgi:uncharacterized protein|uniref:UPF0178 protein FRZ44_45900 n=1 Tax=Hypericibacter terrae TaxID=2602015 RepID=A0A5J6MQ88_9PROT|nr:YaiI/YqxD family protein [Hypericibacter terrae]QEX19277.1 UPF0178 protein [Hypericibacter terrae]
MLEIFVDADACPVKDEVILVAERHGLPVHMVGNTWMRLGGSQSVNRVVVTDGFDAADNWIVEHVGAGDIAITADIRLAARCLERGARVLGPTGKPFTESGIGMALAMRDLNEFLRDSGEIRGGGPSFAKKDRSRFLEALEQAIQTLKREKRTSAGS